MNARRMRKVGVYTEWTELMKDPKYRWTYRWKSLRFWGDFLWYWIRHPRQVHGPAFFCGSCWEIWWKFQIGEWTGLPRHQRSRVPGIKMEIPKLARLG